MSVLLYDGISVRILTGLVNRKIVFDKTICGPYSIRHMAKRGRPKLPVGSKLGEYMEMRLDVAEKEAFVRAAEICGMSLSAWVRARLRAASQRELKKMDMPVPFIEKLSA